MLRAIGAVCIAISVLAYASGGATAAEKLTVGNAFTVVRTVMGTLEANTRQLKLADDIYHNELIETEENSATELVFLDETKLALGPDSSIVIDKFVYDPEPNEASFIATATKGAFRFVTGTLPKKSYTIHTPTATIGIRGTAFTLRIEPQSITDTMKSHRLQFSLEHGAADIAGCGVDEIRLDKPGATVTMVAASNGSCLIDF